MIKLRLAVIAASACLIGSGAMAEVHRVDWHESAEVSIGRSAAGPVVDLVRGFRVSGLDWPARIVRVEVPPDARVTDVEITPRGVHELPVSVSGLRVRETDQVDLGAPDGGEAGYLYWILPEGDYRGHRIAQIVLCPFKVEGDRLFFLTDFDVAVTTTASDSRALARRIHHPRTEAADARALRAMLDAEPAGYPVSDDWSRTTSAPELPPEVHEYVIITNDAMAPAFQELADYKTREGLRAIVTTIEWILANYDGNDLQVRIRSYLRDTYLYQGARYALLGGDTDQVPIRQVMSRFQTPQGTLVTTDKYYACLDGSWNGDGDFEIGEGPDAPSGNLGDDTDLYADISVGRVPASSLAQAEAYIEKWKSYTGYSPENFRTDYQHRILSLGEVLFPTDWVPGDPPGEILMDGADICESTLAFVPPGFSRVRMYEYYNNPEHPGAVPEVLSAVISNINSGFGIIDHVGHGFRTNMSVGDGKLVNKTADELTNTDAYSLLYAVNCSSGAVSFDCIVEHLLLNPSGGIIASVASTDLDYPSISDDYKYEFFRQIFQQNETRLADAFHIADLIRIGLAAQSENAYRWTFMTLLAMGDPALEIWRDTPRTLTLTHNPSLVLGTGSFSVTVTRLGVPVEGARVTLWKDDGYGVAETNASGVATIPFLPETVGTFTITAVKNSYVPKVKTATVVAPVTAALRVDGITVHDGTAGGGAGNADNRADAGESVVMDVTLRNDGSATATGVSVTMHAPGAFLTVTDSTQTSVDIPAQSTQTLTAAFAFQVSADLPDTIRHEVVPATFDLTSAQGTWNDEFAFSVYQRILDLVKLRWSIPDDDGDGFLESGETAEILLTLKNRGEATTKDLVAVGSYTGSQFVFLDDTIQFGALAAGAEVQAGPLRLLSTGGGAPGLIVDLNVSDAYSASLLGRRLDVLYPVPPDTLMFRPSPTAVRLTWPLSVTPDVRGYRVFRSGNPIGPYSEISQDIVDFGSFFADEGLPPLTTYWYRVTSVDSSGNQSAPSDTVRASTSPPVLEGWPVPLPPGESKGSPTFADVDRNGEHDVILGWNYPMVFRANGGDFVDGDGNALTAGIFSTVGNGDSKFWNSPAVFDIDTDGVVELIFCAWNIDNGPAYLYVLDATGAVEPGWPKQIGRQPWSTAAVGDVDGNGYYEIFVSSGASFGDFVGALFGFRHNGTEIIDGDANPATTGVFFKVTGADPRYQYGSPALADIDNDGVDEIVWVAKTVHSGGTTASKLYVLEGNGTVRAGFPYTTLTGSTSSPAVADLDGNGTREIVVVTDSQIAVVTSTGGNFGGWPKSLPPATLTEMKDFLSSPAIGDVNGNGQLDIALGWTNARVYLWTGQGGAAHASFPVEVMDYGSEWERYLHSPILGNIDSDPKPEIIVSSGNDLLHAVKWNGAMVTGFPLQLQGTVYGSPATWDLNGDGHVNLIVQTTAPLLEVFDFVTVPFVFAEHPWPMFRRDQRKSGTYRAPIVVGVDPEAGSTAPAAAFVHAARPNPFVPRVSIPFDVPEGGGPVAIRVFDIGGREVRRLADGEFPAGEFQISWDGRTETGVRLAPGVYFARIQIGRSTFVQKLTMLP